MRCAPASTLRPGEYVFIDPFTGEAGPTEKHKLALWKSGQRPDLSPLHTSPVYAFVGRCMHTEMKNRTTAVERRCVLYGLFL